MHSAAPAAPAAPTSILGCLAAIATLLLAGCYDDLVVDPDEHPCAECRSCERCLDAQGGARCVPRERHAELRCDSPSRLAWIDSCGATSDIVEQCAVQTECIEPDGGEPACACRNRWQGVLCDVCPAGWDPAQDCGACAAQFQGDDCDECPGHFDEALGCIVCRNRWQGDDCQDCPGHFDEALDCAVCRNRWQGAECDVCAPHFDPASDCSACADRWTGDDCNACRGHRDPASACVSCLPGWVDDGDDCGSCDRGLQLNAQTTACVEVCGNGLVTAGEACDDANAEPLDGCDECAIAPFTVNTETTSAQRAPSVAAASDGTFVVVWMSAGQDGDGWGVYGQRFDAVGNPVGDELQINATTAGDQTDPQVAMMDGGRFAVVWVSPAATGGVLARRFDAAGAPESDEIVVFDAAGQTLSSPVIAGAPDGRFTISGSRGDAVVTQTYDSTGTVVFSLASGAPADPGAATAASGAAVAMSNSGVLIAYVRERRYLAGVDTYVYSDKVMLTYGSSEFYAETGGAEWHDQLAPAVARAPGGDGVAWVELNNGVYSVRARFVALAGPSFELRGDLTDPPADLSLAMFGPTAAAFAWTLASEIHLGVWSGAGTLEQPVRMIAGSEPALAAVPSGLVLVFTRNDDILAERFDSALGALGRTQD